MSRLTPLLPALIAFSAAALADNHEPPVLKSKDIFDLEYAANVQIAPDGGRIVYERRSMDIMTDTARSNLWIVDADGGRHRPLLSGADSYSTPSWSPSGDRIAYVTSAEGRGPEIHVRWMDSGQSAMLTNVQESPSSLAWSPDGEHIAFAMFVPVEGPSFATPPEKPEGAEWAEPVKVIDRLYYRADGRGYLDTGNTHVFIVPADGGTPRQLTSGDFNHTGPLSWSPDGERIAFSANRLEDYEHQPAQSEIWTVEIDDGALTQLTDRLGPDTSPVYSPDGRCIAYRGHDDRKMGYHNTGVYVMDADGSNVRSLTADFDRSIAAVQWAGGGNRLYVTYDDSGDRVFASLSINGDIDEITRDVGGTSLGRPYTSGGFSVADNGAYAYTAGSPYRPAEVASGRRGDTGLDRQTAELRPRAEIPADSRNPRRSVRRLRSPLRG